tara:strand:- start:1165 stop:1368 length:204 start_codon:yes stop_codon:yes gene_type:complete
MSKGDTKAFLGLWVSKATRTKFKVACAVHNVNQGDVMDLLLSKWINKPHIQEEIKELWENKKTEKQK